jgi:threonine/homoserine/homoserine lactone efflux protein
MVTALLVGLMLGWVLAIPPGPMAIAILRQALAGQARAGVAIALGASAMDSVSAGIAGWASSALVASFQSTMREHAWEGVQLTV